VTTRHHCCAVSHETSVRYNTSVAPSRANPRPPQRGLEDQRPCHAHRLRVLIRTNSNNGHDGDAPGQAEHTLSPHRREPAHEETHRAPPTETPPNQSGSSSSLTRCVSGLAREKTIAEYRRRQHTRTCRACPTRSPTRQAATGPLPWTPTEMGGRQEIEATGVTLHPCTRVTLPPAPRCRAGYVQLRIAKRPIEESTKRPIDVGRRSRPIALMPEPDRQMLLSWRPTTETVGRCDAGTKPEFHTVAARPAAWLATRGLESLPIDERARSP
jgi:hypothetical protein